ncbi:MAG: OB-fold domain-containing protein [Candidatus Sericytochromatia bacterium]|nr:OB-fold domain-containing protein [Candidatus Tanganyikabacteria bacterium]
MTIGISSFGCYLPRGTLSRRAIADAWGQTPEFALGVRAVAWFDEDALTMAVEAGAEALLGTERQAVGAVFVATTSAPFAEKSVADVVAAALDLRGEILTADFGGSTRAFSAALRAACDAVQAGSCRNALVIASDMRQVPPGSPAEPGLGDAAAAFVVGSDGLLAEIEQLVTLSDDFTPVWRLAGDRFLSSDDDKVAQEAYVAAALQVARRTLDAAARDTADLTTIVAYAPDSGAFRTLLRASGMGEKFHTATLHGEVGNSGAANLPLQLCAALEEAQPGDRLLAVNWGGTADGLLLRCTDAVAQVPGAARRGIQTWLDGRAALQYQEYLRHRDLLASPGGLWSLDPFSSLTAARRESRQLLRLHGVRCQACGAVLYPVRPACRACGGDGPFDDFRLARRGVVVTWNRDHVYPGFGSPVANVVVDLEGGGRLLTQLAEGTPAIGMPVELALRRLHAGRNLPHYFWKARAPRGVPAVPAPPATAAEVSS